MDKVTQHKKIVRELVEYIAALCPTDEVIENQLITDDEHGHYLLCAVGWEENDYREYATFLHIDVKTNGRVWIQHDGTDLKVALLLVERGIPKSEIVIGFRAPFRRQLMGEYAIE